jgi:hypothetical protein
MSIAAGRLFPGKAKWKTIDQGNTRGGTAFVCSPSWKEEKVDQFGDTVVNKWGYGMSKVSVDLSYAEMTSARMATITGETDTAGTVKLSATSFIGLNQLALAGALAVFPIIGGTLNADPQVELPLAYPQFDLSLPFSDAPQAMKVSYAGFPNEADSNTVAIFNQI